MKKILFSLCTLTLLLVTACNLDLKPTSSISTEEALRSMDDAQKLRRDIYITMRNSLNSGAPDGTDGRFVPRLDHLRQPQR